MKAVVFDGGLGFTSGYPMPEPEDGEALVRVLMAGICNTDLEIIKGYMGFKGVLGHEFVGVVERVAGVAGSGLEGKRVVGEINLACGRCDSCRAGLETHCASRSVLGILAKDGAMAEYLTMPARNLIAVPDGMKDDEAVFTEPLSAAFEIMEQVHVWPTARVLVMGDGKLGLLCAMALVTTQAEVVLLGRHESKLAIARRRGIRTITNPDEAGGRSWDIVVEATGSAEGFGMALGLVRPRGTVVLKSTVASGVSINLAPVVIDEITVIGSRCGPFHPALRAISGGVVDVLPMISGIYKFEDAGSAFMHATAKGSLKILLDFRA